VLALGYRNLPPAVQGAREARYSKYFEDSPLGPPHFFLARDAESDSFVGMSAIFPTQLRVFGELVPKSLALAHAEAFALRLSGFIVLMLRILGPLVRVLTSITTSVARMLGAGEASQGVMSTEELKILVERGGEQGILEAEEEQMIHAVIELGDQRIHEVMVPRIAMISLASSATLEEAKPLKVKAGINELAVVRIGPALYAMHAVCAHAGGPLAEGKVVDGCLECPWHGSRFALQSGHVRRGPAVYDQPSYEVRARDGGGYEVRRRPA